MNILNSIKLFAETQVDTSPLPHVDATTSAPIATILTVVFSVMGAIAFIVIVLSGVKFILSRGNPDEVNKARNAIIYSAIGLAIAVSAVSLVNFVASRL